MTAPLSHLITLLVLLPVAGAVAVVYYLLASVERLAP